MAVIKDTDPWADKSRYQPTSCPVCKECIFDTKWGKCVFDGPFTGYKVIEEPTVEQAPIDEPETEG